MHTLVLILGLIIVPSICVNVEVAQGQSVLVRIANVTSGPNPGTGGVVSPYNSNYVLYQAGLTYKGYDYLVGVDNQGTVVSATISVYQPCSSANEYQTQWGVLNDIPMPVVSIVDTSFTASVGYFRENMTYTIDFVKAQDSNFRSAVVPNFYSAPTADFPNALNNANYGAYDNAGNLWSVSAQNCSQIRFSSNVNFTNLLSCKSPTAGYCVNVTSVAGTPFVDYTGQLVIAVYQNKDRVRTWTYPFQYRFNTYTTVLSSQEVDKLAAFKVSTDMSDAGNLGFTITSTASTSDRYLASPVFDSSLVSKASPSNAQVQVWNFESSTAQQNYIGTYTFQWTVQPDGSIVSISVGVSLSQQPVTSQTYSLSTSIQTYKDAQFTQSSSGPYDTSSPIYIATIYAGSAPFSLSVVNAWLCYPSVSDVVPQYDPSKGLYGCSVPTVAMPASNILQLYANGTASSDTRFSLQSFPGITVGGNPASGFKFQFTSTNVDDRIYYVHLETKLTPTVRSRRRLF
jgi:hypothetical protein